MPEIKEQEIIINKVSDNPDDTINSTDLLNNVTWFMTYDII